MERMSSSAPPATLCPAPRKSTAAAWLVVAALGCAVPSGAAGARAVANPLVLVAGAGTSAPARASPEAERLMAEGHPRARVGDFVAARLAWQRAAEEYADAKNPAGQVAALLGSGEASLALGESARAVATLEQALALARSSSLPQQEAAAANGLGSAYARAGRGEQAKTLLQSSVALAEATGDASTAASALNNLGNLLAGQGLLRQAQAAFRGSLKAAEAAGDEALASRAAGNLARALLEDGRRQEASAMLEATVSRLAKLPPGHDQTYSLISVARLYAQLAHSPEPGRDGWRQQAARTLEQAATIAGQIGDLRAESYAYGYLGELEEQGGAYDQAMEHTQTAILTAQRADAPEALYRWHWQSGRILRAQGRSAAAVHSYQQAVYTLESIRQDLSTDLRSGATSFRQSVGPVYFELADLLLQRAATESDPAQASRDLIDARDTVELVKGAELEDYFQDDCVAALKAKTTGIDRLADRTAAIYPIVLEDRTELLLSLPDGLKQRTASVDRQTLTAEIRAFRSKLEKRTTHEYYPHARRLYDWLFKPMERELARQQIDTLVIVPDGPLRTIPMAALHDGQQFLGSQYALATTPGLTLTDPQPFERTDAVLMLNGLSISAQGFPSLPNVANEIADIHQLFGGTVLENQQFTVANMDREIARRPFSIVHIASHGQFSSDVNDTFLLTYDDKLSMDALERFVGTSRFRDQAVELLTLSACETAAGDDRAALGLAGVAVKAGARSALATLWTVNDPASAALLSEFYRQLQDASVSKAEALRRAQLSLLDNRRYWHPGYWSPFLLIGNWL